MREMGRTFLARDKVGPFVPGAAFVCVQEEHQVLGAIHTETYKHPRPLSCRSSLRSWPMMKDRRKVCEGGVSLFGLDRIDFGVL